MPTLNSLQVILAKGEVGDCQVVDDDVEVRRTLGEEVLDSLGHLVTLAEQLGR